MTHPFDDPDGYEAQYYRLTGHHEVLRMKAADGMFDPAEWRGLIVAMKVAGLWALADEVKAELTNLLSDQPERTNDGNNYHD